MSRRWSLLVVLVAGFQLGQAGLGGHQWGGPTQAQADSSTPGDATLPTVVIPVAPAVTIPTVTIPTATAKAKVKKRRPAHRHRPARVRGLQIWAFLTSYCPGSAGVTASSGSTVFYGMLANDYYPFGTRVFLPPIGITGTVEDRTGDFGMWNHFDVWSPVCYSTPTGWFKVVVQGRR